MHLKVTALTGKCLIVCLQEVSDLRPGCVGGGCFNVVSLEYSKYFIMMVCIGSLVFPSELLSFQGPSWGTPLTPSLLGLALRIVFFIPSL